MGFSKTSFWQNSYSTKWLQRNEFQQNVPSVKWPFSETSFWQNILSAKYTFGKMALAKWLLAKCPDTGYRIIKIDIYCVTITVQNGHVPRFSYSLIG
ncbi:unnamed protein product [Rhizophagus irregularis]|nr:unnamed protein product [Rhizophagus irregularis]